MGKIITLGWSWPVLIEGQIWSLWLLCGKIIYVLEPIAALGLKVGWSSQLNDLLKLNEYQKWRSFSDLCQGSLRFQNYFFFSETIGSFETKVNAEAYERMRMKIYTNELHHKTKMLPCP